MSLSAPSSSQSTAASSASPAASEPLVYSVPGITPALVRDLAGDAVSAGTSGVVGSREPFTDLPLAEYAKATDATVEAAVTRARAAQAAWAQTPVEERATVFGRLHGLLIRERDTVLALTQAETGKSRIHAFDEFMHVLLVAAYTERTAAKALSPEKRRVAVPGLTSTVLHRHPHGVVGHISPWNYPLSLGISDAITPLAAGNALVHKPDTQTALVTLYVRRLAIEAGLDPELWQVVIGDGGETGPAVTSRVDAVSFTGSTKTGIGVAKLAAERLTPTSLELGGKNGMIITAGADITAAAQAAVRGCFSSAGQLCVSIERIYIERSAYSAFRTAFAAATEEYVLGAGYSGQYDVGSLTSAAQLARVTEHVEDALSHGAALVTGGQARPEIAPFSYEPTILEGVTPEALCFAEETFGPVVALYPVDSVDEAVEAVNSTPYGLNASVWAGSRREGREIAVRIRSGAVNVNEIFAATFSSVDSPMQGYGLSGSGGRHGREALEHMTWTQTVSVQGPIGFGVPAGMSADRFIGTMTAGLKLLKALKF